MPVNIIPFSIKNAQSWQTFSVKSAYEVGVFNEKLCKKYTDLLSYLPIDIQIYIFSYNNPYKDIFTQSILENDTLWEKAWLKFYKTIENQHEQFIMKYILEYYQIIPKTQNLVDYLYYPSKTDWLHTTYPDDIFFEIEPKTDKILVTIYKKEPIEGGGFHGILGYSIIEFHCAITEITQPLCQKYNPYYLYYYVYSDDNYILYKYFGYGHPS